MNTIKEQDEKLAERAPTPLSVNDLTVSEDDEQI